MLSGSSAVKQFSYHTFIYFGPFTTCFGFPLIFVWEAAEPDGPRGRAL